MQKIDVPVAWLAGQRGPLELCTRHGEPAEDWRDVEFHPKVPFWVWIAIIPVGLVLGVALKKFSLLVAPLLVLLIGLDKRTRMKVSEWPYCGKCLALGRLRLVGVGTAALGLVVSVLALLKAADGGEVSAVMLAVGAGGLLIAATGVVLKEKFSWRRLARGHVSKDRASIQVRAHVRFAADIRDGVVAERTRSAVRTELNKG